MATLTEAATYDAGVYQLETTDPVAGGAAGTSNKPLLNLTNRTAYLKLHLDNIENGTTVPTGLAVINSQTFTGDPKAPTPALGDNDTSIATTAFVQATLGGYLTKSVAGGSTVTLTAIEAGNGILEFTGVLTAAIAVIVPVSPTRPWIVKNSTTGAFTLTLKTSAGTGVAVTQGKRAFLYCDGANVLTASADFLADLLLVDGAGSGLDADLLDGKEGALYALLASPTLVTPNIGVATGTSFNSLTGLSATSPVIDGTAAVGVATTAARGDHVHPIDTTRAPLASPVFTGFIASQGPLILRGETSEGGQLTLGYGANLATTISGQSNNSWNIDVSATNDFRIFRLNASGVVLQAAVINESTGAIAGVSFNSITGLSATTPVIDGTAAIGVATTAARADHVHPIDTTRAPVDSPSFTSAAYAPTPSASESSTRIATTAWLYAAMATVMTYFGFACSLGATGYIKFPSILGGLIFQWGTAAPAAGVNNIGVTLPVSWPNSYLFGIANDTGGSCYACSLGGSGLSQVLFFTCPYGVSTGAISAHGSVAGTWLAIGY